MADPSLLLLVTCVGCAETPPEPVQPSASICAPDAKATQKSIRTDTLSNCVSAPETIAVALETTSRSATKQTDDAAQTTGSITPQPAVPERSPLIDWSTEKTSLENTPLLRVGAQGQVVQRLQTQLQQLGYDPGTIDGSYGSLTQAAVIKFQQANGLEVDGVVGTATWAKLQQAIAQHNQQAAPITPTSEAQPSSEESNSPPPSAETNPSPSANTVQNSPPASSSAGNYLWVLGWLVIYGGGWVLILKDVTKELRGFRMAAVPRRHKRASAAKSVARQSVVKQPVVKQPVASQPVASQPIISQPVASQAVIKQPIVNQGVAQQQADKPVPVVSVANAPNREATVSSSISYQAAEPQPETSSDRLSVANAPIDEPSLEEEARFIWANQPLEIVPADRGVASPLNNLFVGLNDSGSVKTARHQRRKPGDRSVTQPVANVKQATSAEPTASIEPAASSAEATRATAPTVQPADDETLVAALPIVSEQGDSCTYLLIEDASGLFILRGNELRVINQRLSSQDDAASHVIKVRQTDAKGVSMEKSFKLEIKKTGLATGASTTPVSA